MPISSCMLLSASAIIAAEMMVPCGMGSIVDEVGHVIELLDSLEC